MSRQIIFYVEGYAELEFVMDYDKVSGGPWPFWIWD